MSLEAELWSSSLEELEVVPGPTLLAFIRVLEQRHRHLLYSDYEARLEEMTTEEIKAEYQWLIQAWDQNDTS